MELGALLQVHIQFLAVVGLGSQFHCYQLRAALRSCRLLTILAIWPLLSSKPEMKTHSSVKSKLHFTRKSLIAFEGHLIRSGTQRIVCLSYCQWCHPYSIAQSWGDCLNIVTSSRDDIGHGTRGLGHLRILNFMCYRDTFVLLRPRGVR